LKTRFPELRSIKSVSVLYGQRLHTPKYRFKTEIAYRMHIFYERKKDNFIYKYLQGKYIDYKLSYGIFFVGTFTQSPHFQNCSHNIGDVFVVFAMTCQLMKLRERD
jgi:hypothetical protein